MLSAGRSCVQQLPTWSPAVLSQLRTLSVLSWGRNVEQQCGIEGPDVLVARPTAILDLVQTPGLQAVVAGRLNSGAIIGTDAFMFGSGTAGCLGLGSSDNVGSPCRLEAFVGRASIRAIAPGQIHTLFLDANNRVWACGENKEGQCGLGTPLEVLAHQHRRAFFAESMRPAASSHMAQKRPSPDRFLTYLRAAQPPGGEAPHIAQGWGHLGGAGSSSSSQAGHSFAAAHGSGWGRRLGQPSLSGGTAAPGGSWGWLSGGADGAWAAGGSASSDISSLGLFSSAMEAHVAASAAAPGQLHTPVQIRVGAQAASGASEPAEDGLAGIGGGGEAVVSVAASKYYSVVATSSGEVWTFGADYNGALGSERSWTSSARRVAEPLSAAIAAAGGATDVAAGSTFTAALTASGRVLVWGKLAGGSPAAPGLTAAAGVASAAAAAAAAASNADPACGSMFAEVALPQGVRVTGISAGQQHLLMTDGERVWAVGRWFDAAAEEAGAASWESPQQLLALPGRGIAKIVAGMHSSAVVSADGQLWMWGRLMDEQHGAGIFRRFAAGDGRGPAVDWGWAGFGGAVPRLVDGVEGVRDVALGGWHALALVD